MKGAGCKPVESSREARLSTMRLEVFTDLELVCLLCIRSRLETN